MWAAGVSQGLLWLSVDSLGELGFSFRDIMAGMQPYYALRLIAGLIFLTGTILMGWNLFMTMKGRSPVPCKPMPVAPEWQVAPKNTQDAPAVEATA